MQAGPVIKVARSYNIVVETHRHILTLLPIENTKTISYKIKIIETEN